MKPRTSHRVTRAVPCCHCDVPSTMCEHVQVGSSVAFYYYCSRCWHTPGPNAPSPAHRTETPADPLPPGVNWL